MCTSYPLHENSLKSSVFGCVIPAARISDSQGILDAVHHPFSRPPHRQLRSGMSQYNRVWIFISAFPSIGSALPPKADLCAEIPYLRPLCSREQTLVLRTRISYSIKFLTITKSNASVTAITSQTQRQPHMLGQKKKNLRHTLLGQRGGRG